jgi:hypothetical protein
MAGKSVLPPPYLPPIEDEEDIIFHDTTADKFILHSSSVAPSPEFDNIFQVRTSTFLRFCMWCIHTMRFISDASYTVRTDVGSKGVDCLESVIVIINVVVVIRH